jgi:hypothetical protein
MVMTMIHVRVSAVIREHMSPYTIFVDLHYARLWVVMNHDLNASFVGP